MLFDSATSGAAPSDGSSGTLTYFTRFLLGDPVTAASEQWSEADIKAAINREYQSLREIARQFGLGATTKRTYATGVASQIYYQRPADIVKLEAVEVSNTGSNLATATVAAADILYPQPWPAEKALQAYNTRILTDVAERFFLQDDHIGILAPITSTQAGTNSIRLLYEASTTELSADSDEPEIPRPYHDLICYRAAVVLKVMRGQDASDLAAIAQNKEYGYRLACQDAVAMYEDAIPVQGLRQQPSTIHTVTVGTVSRTVRGNADNDVYP